MKKQGQRNKKKILPRSNFLLIIAMGFFVCTVFFLSIEKIFYSFHPPETAQTEMRRLPGSVRKAIHLTPPAQTFRVPMLMYHYVENVKDRKDTIRRSLATAPSLLEAQVQTLVNAGYSFMTAGEVGQVLDGEKALPKRPIVLTFDDGYEDFYTDAYPVLKKYHVKATIYVVPGVLNKKNYLMMRQLQEIARDGRIEIAAHTVNHAYLKGASDSVVGQEVRESKKQLERLIKKPVVSFAYPYGAFDDHTLGVVRNTGFTNAVSTIPGIEMNQQNRYFLSRLRPGLRIGEDLLRYFAQSSFTAW